MFAPVFVPTCEADVTAEWMQGQVLKGHIKEKFQVVNHSTECATNSEDREGFTSIMVKTETEVQVDGETKPRRYKLFVKMFPSNEQHRATLREVAVFEREIHVYTKLLAQIEGAQRKDGRKILQPDWPKCFYTCSDPLQKLSVLVMEDLLASGYQMMDRKAGLDHEHLLSAMRGFAHSHALTFNVKRQLGVEAFLLNNVCLLDDPFRLFAQLIEVNYDVAIIYLRQLKQDNLADRMEAFKKKHKQGLWGRVAEIMSQRGKMATLVHGDCWTNNIMFLHDALEKPIGVKLIDLQIYRYCHPCVDLNHLFVSSSSKASREPLEELLKEYYNTFFDVLEQVGNAFSKKEYTFEELRKDFDFFREYAFVMGIFFVLATMVDGKEMPNLDLTEEGTDVMQVIIQWVQSRQDNPLPNEVAERLLELIQETADYNII